MLIREMRRVLLKIDFLAALIQAAGACGNESKACQRSGRALGKRFRQIQHPLGACGDHARAGCKRWVMSLKKA